MESYSKVLVARYSPENHCYACEGEVLSLQPRSKVNVSKTGVVKPQHHFVSGQDGKTPSRYGWVRECRQSFTVDDFIESHITPWRRIVSSSEREGIQIMLHAIQSLPENTPVTADYSLYGIIEKRVELKVHKVIFYQQ